MRIVAICKSDGSAASTKYRIGALLEHAAAQGIATKLIGVPPQPRWRWTRRRFDDYRELSGILRSVDSDTVLLLQRVYRRPELLWLIGRHASRAGAVIADVDDAFWTHSRREWEAAVRLSDEVWCGSRRAMAEATRLGAATRLVPTAVDTTAFNRPRQLREVPTIGWLGDTTAHIDNLLWFAKVLGDIRHDLPHHRMLIVGVRSDPDEQRLRQALHFADVEFVRWRDPRYIDSDFLPDQLSRFWVSVMPLRETDFNAGRSSYKLILSLAGGVPVVASDLGENQHLVVPPLHGFIARTADQWRQGLSTLLTDETLNRRVGEQGRRFVREHCDRKRLFEELLSLLQQQLRTPRSR